MTKEQEALKLVRDWIAERPADRPVSAGKMISIIDRALAQPVQESVALDEYDAGLLNDYGGGNVEWWQDYIRAELGRAYEHYQSQAATPPAAQPAPVQPDDNGITVDLLERLKATLTKLGYATPEGGLEVFGARLPEQLYNLCRAVDGLLKAALAQPEQKDAARYQHIKGMARAMSLDMGGNHYWHMGLRDIRGPNLDEAIDRAIKAEGQA
jgi:hypothetical protein